MGVSSSSPADLGEMMTEHQGSEAAAGSSAATALGSRRTRNQAPNRREVVLGPFNEAAHRSVNPALASK